MGKGRRKFDLRKNYELTMKVKVPLSLLKPFVVSIPLASYINAPATSGQALVARLVATKQLPSGWSYSSTTLYIQAAVYSTAAYTISHFFQKRTKVWPF